MSLLWPVDGVIKEFLMVLRVFLNGFHGIISLEVEIMYNILICDDEKDIVAALKIYLSGNDYNLYEA